MAPEAQHSQKPPLTPRLTICILEDQEHLRCILLAKGARIGEQEESVNALGKATIATRRRIFHFYHTISFVKRMGSEIHA
jgi:hypothetical protein